MTLRIMLPRSISALAIAISALLPLSHAEATRPNVLFIAVDDLNTALGCFGDPLAITPNIDALAARGAVFLNNHCQQPVCGPSRASIMTGLLPDTSGVVDFGIQMRQVVPNAVTLAQHFKENGYFATGMGKIYDGRNVDGWRTQDIPSWSGKYLTPWPPEIDRLVKGYRNADTVAAIEKYRAAHNGQDAEKGALFPAVEGSEDVPDNYYFDGAYADEAARQLPILAAKDEPFFLAVGFEKPHLPFVAPKKYWDMYERSDFKIHPFQKPPAGAPPYAPTNSGELAWGYDLPEGNVPVPPEQQLELIHGYYACVTYVDAQLGKILNALEENDLTDSTVIVFWSDHGFHLGDHALWTKHNHYEFSTRSPLIIVDPRLDKAGISITSPTELTDVYPTLVALANLPAPPQELDGVSLAPLLADPTTEVREVAMSQYPKRDWSQKGAHRMGYSYRSDRYRYIIWKDYNFAEADDGPIIDRELYDYEKDPLETVNLIDDPDYASIVEQMERARLDHPNNQ